MDPVSAASAIAALVGLFKGGGQQVSPTGLSPDLQAQLMKMLQLQTDRASSSQPVHNAAMAMALRLAPAYARNAAGGASPNGGLPTSVTPSNPSGAAPGGSGAGSSLFSGFNAAGGNAFTDVADAIRRGTAQTGSSDVGVNYDGITYINGHPYMSPGDNKRPTTGPEDPNPMHHPIDEATAREVSAALMRWFGGNPGGAFFGNGMSSTQQNGSDGGLWNGRGRAY